MPFQCAKCNTLWDAYYNAWALQSEVQERLETSKRTSGAEAIASLSALIEALREGTASASLAMKQHAATHSIPSMQAKSAMRTRSSYLHAQHA